MIKGYLFENEELYFSDGEKAHVVLKKEQVEAIKFVVKSMIGDNNKQTARRTADVVRREIKSELKNIYSSLGGYELGSDEDE